MSRQRTPSLHLKGQHALDHDPSQAFRPAEHLPPGDSAPTLTAFPLARLVRHESLLAWVRPRHPPMDARVAVYHPSLARGGGSDVPFADGARRRVCRGGDRVDG